MNTLICTKCKVEQPDENFPIAKIRGKVYLNGSRRGRSSHCRSCNNKRAKEWAAKNHKRVAANARAGHLRRKFNITVEEFDSKLALQKGQCAICGCTADSPRLKQQEFCVDHDHETGKIRDLLCDHCNLILGNANDNIELLTKAIRYLKKHGKKL